MDDFTAQPASWHVARRVALPLDTAAIALDAAVHPHVFGGKRAATLALVPIAALSYGLVARRFTGGLRLAGLGGVIPVEAELAAWSRSESELGVRPTGRPPVRRAARYFEAADTALAVLSSRILEAAPTDDPRVAALLRAS
jgi:hypothetical protein